jgi:tRNA threonylcarbamoyladenosine biosynthesis protein TsaE
MVLLGISFTFEELAAVVQQFWSIAKPYPIITFSGEMGAGKTTFVSALCAATNVDDHVTSPTFALINEYRIWEGGIEKPIFHLDWYRLRDAAEAVAAGMEDCLDQAKTGNAYCFIEWPEKAPELLTMEHLSVRIETVGFEKRSMTVELVPSQR